MLKQTVSTQERTSNDDVVMYDKSVRLVQSFVQVAGVIYK